MLPDEVAFPFPVHACQMNGALALDVPGSWTSPLLLRGALLGALLRLTGAIRFAVDGEDLGVVDDAVDQGDHAGGIGEDLGPFGERAVRGQQQAFVLVAAAHDLEEQIGIAVAVGEVAHLVDFG